MFNRESSDKLLTLIEELGAKRGINLPPPDPLPEQQHVYEKYVRSMNYDPDSVDRMIEMGRIPEQQRGMIHGMLLNGLIKSDSMSDSDLKALLVLVRMVFSEQRATGLLRTVSAPILRYARAANPAIDRPLSLGVFPLRWFNGQSTLFENTAMCLVATGAFDLIEIFSTLFDARRKDPTYAVQHMRKALDNYVRTGEVASAEYELASGLVDFGDVSRIGVLLTTSAEEFLVSHELGHVALGHIDRASRGAMPLQAKPRPANWLDRLRGRTPVPEQTITVIQPKHVEEHCADVWALKTVLDVAKSSTKEAEEKQAIACGGAAAFLGLALLTEAASRHAGSGMEDSHPPALTRLYIVEVAFELVGQHENAFVARRVREFVEEIGAGYRDFEMPPMLDRSLNKTAACVFEQLGFDLSKAPYITDFQ
ncbi:MAG TPA: hypothetical protein DC047_02995 [Blastocatellia bacterium]|nr:hypothetical protein [Blastocatellia bacterium]